MLTTEIYKIISFKDNLRMIILQLKIDCSNQVEKQPWDFSMKNTRIFILCSTFAYTLLRYVGFGEVDMTQIPVFLINKSISMSSVVFLFLSAYHTYKNQITESKFWGRDALYSAILHILFSVSILSASYYSKLFLENRLTLQGGLFIFFGICAIFLFIVHKNPELKDKDCRTYCQLAALCLLGHLFFLGYSGWFNIDSWYGYLPPISLLSFLFVLAAEFFYLKKQN